MAMDTLILMFIGNTRKGNMNYQEIIDSVIEHHKRGDETVSVNDIAMTFGYEEKDVESCFIELKEIGLMDNNSEGLWWSKVKEATIVEDWEYFTLQ